MIPIILILTVIKYFPDKHFTKIDFDWHVKNSQGKRKAKEASKILINPTTLQEICIVGAYNFHDKKYTKFFNWYNSGMLRIIKNKELATFLLNLLDSLIGVFGYGIIFSNMILNKITLGTATFQIKAIETLSSSLDGVLSSLSFMNEFSTNMQDLVTLFDMKPSIQDGKVKLPSLTTPPKIEFRNVSFKYPNADKFVFKNLNFKVNSGEEIALVGHNGAGKTTIVKLLSKIYQVTEGEILINDININDLSINDWYKNIGVLFQDFNFYHHLTVKENIFLGRPTKKLDFKKIVKAAKDADAHEFIEEYKNKYDQILSEKFEGGIRPSTGQQQKIAIARFFYRNAPLVIFDEPTAAIDAVSEYKIFNKIYKSFNNKTVIIISHRFSTVRNAHRIIVLDKGEIVEEGTHAELLSKMGFYEKAFRLQAEGYKN